MDAPPPASTVAPCPACGGELGPLSRCRSCGCASEVKAYRLEAVLSQRPHSRVYVGRRVDGGPQVAVKELLFSLVPTAEQVEAFYREAALLRTLQHPRCPRFVEAFGVGEGVETRLYLVQEFIEGETLQARLDRGQLLSGQAFDDVAAQVLETLAALHGRSPRILHRDLKPANLVFRPDGQLVLVDFGSARQLEDGVHRSNLARTSGYHPPEPPGASEDESVDVHAVGATLLHAATGKPPSTFLVDGWSLSFGDLPALSPRQNAFLARLTAPRRADRFPSASAALEWMQKPGRPGVGRLSVAAAALVLALAGVAIVVVVTDPPHPSTRPAPARPPPAPAPAAAAPAAADVAVPSPEEKLLQEQEANTRAIWVGEKSFFAERDRYALDFTQLGFQPDQWCPDGARARHQVKPRAGEAVGCHFLYGVWLEGQAPRQALTVYARGAVEPVLGKAWVTRFEGPTAGITELWTQARLDAALPPAGN